MQTKLSRNSKGRFSQGPRSEEEASHQRTFTQSMMLYGGECLFHSIPNESKRSAKQGADLKAMGLRPGVADYLVMWAVAGGCQKAFYIEFKSAKGKQSDTQLDFEKDVNRIGALYAVCRTWMQAWDLLAMAGAPLTHILQPESQHGRFIPNPRLHYLGIDRARGLGETAYTPALKVGS